jgi:hypothetical protein
MVTVRVRAQNLRVGDRCRGSRALVVVAPSAGARTPRGKVELVVEYPAKAGKAPNRRRACWGAGTIIGIERPDVTAEETHPDAEQHAPIPAEDAPEALEREAPATPRRWTLIPAPRRACQESDLDKRDAL